MNNNKIDSLGGQFVRYYTMKNLAKDPWVLLLLFMHRLL
jgi:hypothetical protein